MRRTYYVYFVSGHLLASTPAGDHYNAPFEEVIPWSTPVVSDEGRKDIAKHLEQSISASLRDQDLKDHKVEDVVLRNLTLLHRVTLGHDGEVEEVTP